jgi:hypothetical protein
MLPLLDSIKKLLLSLNSANEIDRLQRFAAILSIGNHMFEKARMCKTLTPDIEGSWGMFVELLESSVLSIEDDVLPDRAIDLATGRLENLRYYIVESEVNSQR